MPKLLDERNRRHRRGIAQRAERSPQHVLGEITNIVEVLIHATPDMYAANFLLNPVYAFATGDTPAAALMLVKLDRAQRKLNHTRLVVDHDDAGRAKHAARLAELIKIHADVNFLGQHNRSRRSARNDSLQLTAAANATADIIDGLLQVVPHRQLINAGIHHMPTDPK